MLAALTDTFTARLALRTALDPKVLGVGAWAIEACGALTKALEAVFLVDLEATAMERMALERATMEADMTLMFR